ncbi:MAG: PilZ domain-containing protein [Gammaproteobacteria bacterium]|nr:PilZ domain-containing protein [Gammaproteobacteria bacterium]
MSILTCMNLENNLMHSNERRHFSRIPFHAEIVMQSGDAEWTANLLDISLKGMLVEPPGNLDIDTSKPCAIALFLADDVTISARVRIKYIKDNLWGLEYMQIEKESLEHLQRLLKLNLKSADLINRELSELGHGGID